jgi:hypothetical protein
MEDQQAPSETVSSDLFSFVLSDDWSVNLHLSPIPLLILAAIFAVIFLLTQAYRKHKLVDWELDGAEMGLGDHKLSFKPNNTDRQIAYRNVSTTLRQWLWNFKLGFLLLALVD